MVSRLGKNDTKKYLGYGNMTQPFLDTKVVIHAVMTNVENHRRQGENISVVESLMSWINYNVKPARSEDFKRQNKFGRSAEEIWNSGMATGCTDYAILFMTMARQLGIPTTMLETAERQWLVNSIYGKKEDSHRGHAFCECYVNGNWILVDPTYKKVEKAYDPTEISLSYSVGGSSKFVPYRRSIDLGEKKTVQSYNREMDKLCDKLL